MADHDYSLESRYSRTHELCRPTELVVHLPDTNDEKRTQTVPIKKDASYVIDRDDDGELRVLPDKPH